MEEGRNEEENGEGEMRVRGKESVKIIFR